MGRKSILTKAELAAELNLSRGRISQLVAAGLPVRPDGRVLSTVAVAWYKNNIVPHLGAAKGAHPAEASQAAAPPARQPSMGWQEIYKSGFHHGACVAAYRACCLLPPFAEACASEAFGRLLDRDTLAAQVFPVAAAVSLFGRCFSAELSRACEAGLPAPEVRFGLFSDPDHARRLFGEAVEVCRNLPGPGDSASSEPQRGIFEDASAKGAMVIGARLACSIAGAFCELICGQIPAGESCEDLRLWDRVYPVALFRMLVFGWCEAPLAGARKLGLPDPPPPRFELFGSQAEAARQAFEEFEVILAGG